MEWSRYKILFFVTWIASMLALIFGLFFIWDKHLSRTSQIVANLLVQAGGAFFFALSVGWIIERLRNAEGYSVLWLLSQEFRKAGVLSFYSDRKNNAVESLKNAFKYHSKGEVLLAGASLRAFFNPTSRYYESIKDVLFNNANSSVAVRCIYCNPEDNHELPVRSFIEEFDQDGSFPKSSIPFDWRKPISFSFNNFKKTFFTKHGIGSVNTCRVIKDLEGTRSGIKALAGIVSSNNNSILYRESRFAAPYCTIIIFPDKVFYTPNLLSSKVPVNMPMIVFHKSSDAYKILLDYFEFLWWVNG